MVKALQIILALILIGCGSTSKKSNITNDDFKKQKALRYKKKSDFYKAKVDSKQPTILESETLATLPDGVIEDIKPGNDIVLMISQHCHTGKSKEAFELAKQHSDRYLKYPSYWNVLGVCFTIQGEEKKAFLYFNKALSLKSNFAPAYNNIGIIYKRNNELNKAIVAFKKALKMNRNARTTKLNLAQTLLEVGLPDQALSYYQELNKIGKDREVLVGLATSLMQVGKDSLAIDYFSKLDKDFIESPRAGLNYSLALYKAGKKDKAHDVFDDVDKDKAKGDMRSYYNNVKNWIGVK
jgi:tetratricopeptide (TPR) repeat protein